MCGIAGIVNFSGVDDWDEGQLRYTLGDMAQSMAHRGPDDSGVYIVGETSSDGANNSCMRRGGVNGESVSGIDVSGVSCGLAHRRLSIIDLAGGSQPMVNPATGSSICYNGECYNFKDLRRELENRGHSFRTQSDTEVVLHLYDEYGADCVKKMRGMFAFAVWQPTKGCLFLARDRMGQKPLYYALHKGRFIFASECKAILRYPGFPRRADLAAISRYLLLQYVPAPASGFADIKQLEPASCVTVTVENYKRIEPVRYWYIPERVSFAGSIEEAAEQLRYELKEAVRMRMISDVPLGGFLSGGIDSTVVVGLMSRLIAGPVISCAMGFKEQNYNELGWAEQAAKAFNTQHYQQMVEANCQQTVESLSYFYDEPFADCSALPSYHLARLARQYVTVALTGDGGDECFGGYDRYKAMYLAERVSNNRLLLWLARRGFWQKIPAGEHRSRLRAVKRFMEAAALPAASRYLKWMAVFDPDMLGDMLSDMPGESMAGGRALSGGCGNHNMGDDCDWDALRGYFENDNGSGDSNGYGGGEKDYTDAERARQAMYYDGNNYLPGDLNVKVDRASMAVGLELRCPFEDHKVVELAYSMPVRFRHNGRESKRVLRNAFAELIPESIKKRPKMGFGVPVGRWFRGELRDMFVDTVLSERALQRGYFRREAIERLLAENDSNREDHGHRLWALLMLELWHRNYID